jgi:hypothetical protein
VGVHPVLKTDIAGAVSQTQEEGANDPNGKHSKLVNVSKNP